MHDSFCNYFVPRHITIAPNIFSFSLTAFEIGSTKVATMVPDLPSGPQLKVHFVGTSPLRSIESVSVLLFMVANNSQVLLISLSTSNVPCMKFQHVGHPDISHT